MSKYGAIKTFIGNKSFPSRLEAAVYSILLMREKAGEIRNIKCQVPVRLKERCSACDSPAVVYKVDFSYEDAKTLKTVFVESKGVKTSTYLIRERLWRKNPPAELQIWQGSWIRPRLVEVIK